MNVKDGVLEKMSREGKCLIAVGLFAIAMAYLESAVVVYLRAVYGIEDLLRDMPLTPDQHTLIELGREAATLVMLAMIGWIAGRRWQDRVGYAIFSFGLWDVLYYAWLVIFIGWPKTLLEMWAGLSKTNWPAGWRQRPSTHPAT